jgi:phage terminase Nu1 subunit (DNA packaging protein)
MAKNGIAALQKTVHDLTGAAENLESRREVVVAERALREAQDQLEKIEAQRLRAEQLRLQLAKEKGELIPIENVELVFSDIFDTLYAELGGVPAASTRDLALRGIIEGHVDGAFGRARAKFIRKQKELRTQGRFAPDEEADDDAEAA